VPVRAGGAAGAWLRLARELRRAAAGEGGANPLARVPGRIWGALVRRGAAGWPRDLWFFWREAQRRGLAGTAERPARATSPPAVAEEAAARVRRLLATPPGPPSPPARTGRGGAPPAPARPGGCGAA
jgi:hypothetical protein